MSKCRKKKPRKNKKKSSMKKIMINPMLGQSMLSFLIK